jgi:sterol desaturase/sphingolipid hydroxylase (fatty acid hydroxylase superfamily)
MHWKKIYPYVHKIHHKSVNPTPWAAFAFHPLEAIMEVGIVPIMVFLIPLHPLALLSWVLYQTGMNVLGHLGFELFPKGFTTGRITKWHNTSVHHNMHHKHVNCNYGLYYNFWDRIMGTNHVRYSEEFESIKLRAEGETQEAKIPQPVVS